MFGVFSCKKSKELYRKCECVIIYWDCVPNFVCVGGGKEEKAPMCVKCN